MYQLVALIVPLVTAPYLVRVIGAEGTGVYSYVNSVTSLVTTFVMLGIFSYGNRQIAYVRDDPKKLNDTFWRIMTCRLVISIIGTVIFVLIVLINGRYYLYFLYYYTYMLGYFVDCTWLFVGVEDMKWAVLKNTIMKLLAAAMIFLFVKNSEDVGLYIFIQGASILFANMLAYSQLKRYVSRLKLIFKGIKKDLYGSFLLFLPSMAATIYLQCDKIMIELLGHQTNQVSQYDYAEKIVTIPLSFITVLSTVMMPRIAYEFAKGRKKEIAVLLNKAATISLFLACPLTFGMMAIAGKLIPWYLGSEFLPSIIVIMIISPIIVTNTLTGISGNQYFTATNQIAILMKAQVTACVGNIIVNAILIPKYGLYGAAIATLLSSIVCATIQYVFLCRQIKLPRLMITGLKYTIYSFGMFVILLIVTNGMKASPITNIAQIFIGAGIYLTFCLITKDQTLRELFYIVRTKMRR